MVRALLAIFFVLNISPIHAQLDTAFYLAPIPEWLNQTQEIEISTPFSKRHCHYFQLRQFIL